MLKKLFAIAFFSLGSTAAFGQCTKDTDCKGDRICSEGSCVAPAPGIYTPQPLLQSPVGPLSQVQSLELLQARSKANTSLLLAGGTLLTGLGTAATNGAGDAPKVLGGMTLALAAAATPIAAGGGNQARRLARARGVQLPQSTARVTAWTGYGLTMGMGTVVFAAGLSDADISNGLILSLTTLGALSATTMALDTMSTVSAIKAQQGHASLRGSSRSGFSARLTASASHEGATLGLVGRF